MSALRRALFFDRDGTLNREVQGALARRDQLELLPGAARAVMRANQAGWLAIVVSNQSALARGWMNAWDLEQVHGELRRLLALEGARLDDVFHCPHFDGEGVAPYVRSCACRKPAPGLLRFAALRHSIDLSNSWVVGDALRDLEAAAAVGARSILVRTGKGVREASKLQGPGALASTARPQAVVDGVDEAVRLALDQGR